MITLTSTASSIDLPDPILGDSEQLNVFAKYEFSMSRIVHSTIKTVAHSKLLLTFDSLITTKMEELKAFLIASRGLVCTYTDYNGTDWDGILLGDPFEFTQVANDMRIPDSHDCGEMWSISLEFEATNAMSTVITVSGTSSPNVSGDYSINGLYNSQKVYINTVTAKYIWYTGSAWKISSGVGILTNAFTSSTLTGKYTGGISGNPIVVDPAIISYLVIGTLSPDGTGVYEENGTYNGEPAYRRTDSGFWLWDLGGNIWVITLAKGYTHDEWIKTSSLDPAGSYLPGFGIWTGTAVVSLI